MAASKVTIITCDVFIPGDYAVPIHTYEYDQSEDVLVELDDNDDPTGRTSPTGEPPSDWGVDPNYDSETVYYARLSEDGIADGVSTTLTIEVPNAVTMDEAEALVQRAINQMSLLRGGGIQATSLPHIS